MSTFSSDPLLSRNASRGGSSAGLSATHAALVVVCLLFLSVIVPDVCVVVFGLVAGMAALATYKIHRLLPLSYTEPLPRKMRGDGRKASCSVAARASPEASNLASDSSLSGHGGAGPFETTMSPTAADRLSADILSAPEAEAGIASCDQSLLEATASPEPSSPFIADLIEEKVNVQWLSGRSSELSLVKGASVRQAREVAGIDRGVSSKRIMLLNGPSILNDEMLLQDIVPESTLQGIVIDGWRAVTASYDHTLRVWDLLVGTCLGVLEGHTDRVSALSCDHGRQRAISGSWDSTIRVWDLDLLTCSGVLEGHSGSISALAADFGQEIALSGSWDGTLCLWHLGRLECLATLGDSLGRVVSLDVDFSTGHALSRSDDGVLTVWDVKKQQDIATLDGHAGWLTASTCDMVAKQAITGAFDGSLRLWDIERAVREAVPKDDSAFGGSVASSFASAPPCWAGIANKSHPAASPLGNPNGHDGAVNAIVADFGESVKRAVTGGPDGLRVWDLVSKTCLVSCLARGEVIRALAVDFGGERAICGVAGGTIKVWDLSAAAAEAAAAAKAAEAAAAAAASSSKLTPVTLSALGEDCSGSRAPTETDSVLESDTGMSESAWGTDQGWSTATDTEGGSALRRNRRGGQNHGNRALVRRPRRDRGARARTGAAVFGENTGAASSLLLREVSSIVADFPHSRVLTCASDGTLQTWEVPKEYRGTTGTTTTDSQPQDPALKVTATLEGHQRSVAVLSCE